MKEKKNEKKKNWNLKKYRSRFRVSLNVYTTDPKPDKSFFQIFSYTILCYLQEINRAQKKLI